MWHKQSFTQFWSQSDAYSRRSSLKLTYIHHPLVVCTHQICCAVAVPIALSQDRRLHGHNRLVNWTPCSRMRESKLIRPTNHKSVMPANQRSCLLPHWQVLLPRCDGRMVKYRTRGCGLHVTLLPGVRIPVLPWVICGVTLSRWLSSRGWFQST